MRFIVLCLLFALIGSLPGYCQQDTLTRSGINTAPQKGISVLDSVVLATQARKKFIADSEAMQYIKYPDSSTRKQYFEQLKKQYAYKGDSFLSATYKSNGILRDGHTRPTRDKWIITMIIALLLYMALLNIVMNRDVKNVFQSFYSKRALLQAGKDEGQINFWSFIGLFLLFGLTFGLFLYQLAAYKGAYFSVSGFRLFTSLSVIILLLFSFKFVVLKFVGFIFDIQKLVNEYVSILYLTYFNIAFVFLPVIVCFSLLAAQFIPYLLGVAILLIVIIFTWLYIRSSVNIISNIRFHKFYLFIYLCALEICPILILIKALDI